MSIDEIEKEIEKETLEVLIKKIEKMSNLYESENDINSITEYL
jgi:hypothetical protein